MAEILPEQAELDKALQRQAAELQLTLNTKGWQEIAEPLLDKMIEDIIGAKRNGRWDTGAFNPQRPVGMTVEQMAWYRQGLIDFQNRLIDIIDAGAIAKEREKNSAQADASNLPSHPMLQGGYAAQEGETIDTQHRATFSSYQADVLDEDSNGGIQS